MEHKFSFFRLPLFQKAYVQYVHLSVRFGNTLKFVLLLDSVAVGASLGSINQLISQALGDRFDVTERGFAGTSAKKPNSLVDASEGRNINSLTTNCSSTTNPGGVLTWSRVDNSIHQNLERVLKAEESKLQRA